MEKRKNKTRVLAFASTFIILISLCATIAFAQAPETNIDVYGSSPNVIVTAYKYQPTETYPYSTPLWQYQAYGFTYSQLYPDGFATGDDVAIFFENYYIEYDLSDLYNNNYNFVVQIIDYNSMSSGTLNWFIVSGTLETAINSSFFPLSDSSTFTESLESAYYNQFTYWENQFENEYNQGYEEGRSYGYTQALTDVEALENAFVTIFNAPFDFLTNISEVQLFGISIFDIVGVILVLALGYLLLRFIGGAIPL